MSNLIQDVRFAFRQMRRSPGFALTAVLTLALGITANVVVYGLLQGLVLRPLNVPGASQVVMVQHGPGEANLSYPEVRDLRDGSRVFSAVAAERLMDFGLEARGTTRPAWGFEVSGQYFEVLPVKPYLGRLLQRADDDHPGAAEVVVLSFGAWKRDFAGDPAVVGQTVRIDRHPYTVVGVTPEGFNGTEKFLQPAFFLPMANEAQLEGFNWLEVRRNQGVWATARVRDGVSRQQVAAELATLCARMGREHPQEEDHLKMIVTQPGLLGDLFGSPARAFLLALSGLAALVLLAACANLGNLFAARTADRSREMAIRLAIGSSRWRILRQVLAEALALALLGGVCAAMLAWAALKGLANWHPPASFPVQFAVQPDASVLVVALGCSLLAGLIFGMLPLRQIFAASPIDSIKGAGSGQAMGQRRWALRDVLLLGQIALCCVTVTAAFVSLRGLQHALVMQLGFAPERAVLTRFELGQAGYSTEKAGPFQQALLQRVAQLPGVEAAGYANTTPLAIDQSTTSVYRREATDFRRTNVQFGAPYYDVSPGYLRASGTILLAGRDFTWADDAKAPAVAIVNREFARRLFGGPQAAVGQSFKNLSGLELRIVGVVADGKYETLSEETRPAMFAPILQEPNTSTAMVARLAAGAAAAEKKETAAAMRRLLQEADPGVPVQEASGWGSQLAMQLFPARAATVALGTFGAFGLLLSVTGTFGLASYTVTKRLKELSLRVALGAQARQVVEAALGRTMLLLLTGSGVGLLLGMAASRLMAAVVYHANAADPLVLGAVALTMLLTGMLAVAAPVRRAIRVDPARLLRED